MHDIIFAVVREASQGIDRFTYRCAAGDGLPPLGRRAAGGASSGDGVSPVAAIDATGRYASPLAPEGIAT